MTADQIDDPAPRLGSELLGDLVYTYNLQVPSSSPVTVSGDRELEDFRQRAHPDLIFEFYTYEWRTFYFLDLEHYDIWYYGKARLIDGRTGAVMRQAKCAHKPIKTESSPTIEGLVADHGAKLRAAVDAAKELCLATLRQEFALRDSPGQSEGSQ